MIEVFNIDYRRKNHLDVPEAEQTSNSKQQQISSDLHPGGAASFCLSVRSPQPSFSSALHFHRRLPLSVLTEGPETDTQLMKPGHQSVALRLLAVIDDLEKAHATFQSKEKDEGASVILKP